MAVTSGGCGWNHDKNHETISVWTFHNPDSWIFIDALVLPQMVFLTQVFLLKVLSGASILQKITHLKNLFFNQSHHDQVWMPLSLVKKYV